MAQVTWYGLSHTQASKRVAGYEPLWHRMADLPHLTSTCGVAIDQESQRDGRPIGRHCARCDHTEGYGIQCPYDEACARCRKAMAE